MSPHRVRPRRAASALGLALALGLFGGCGAEDGSADDEGAADATFLDVLLEPEAVIIDGLAAGDGNDDIRDGWSVRFSKYIAAVGAVELSLPSEEREASDARIVAVDLTQLGASGEQLWALGGLSEGRWDFGFSTGIEGAERHESVSEEDFALMQTEDFTYLLEGELTKAGGVSCPPAALAEPSAERTSTGEGPGGDPCYPAETVRFAFGSAAEVEFGPCEIDGLPGVAVTKGQRSVAAITLHGDHLFFNGFPEGAEGGVLRLAQWLADCDLDLDGTVTRDELLAIAPSALPELDSRYQLGGSPITPLVTMADYVEGQLMTQGHFQGEGECPVNGVAHEHGEDGH